MKKAIIVLLALALLPSVSNAEDGWDFRLVPYLWFAGVKGDVSTIPGAPIVPIEISPSEAIENSQVSLMAIFEAKKQRHGVLADVIYTDSESDTDLVPAINLTLKSISRNKIFSAAYSYEVFNQDSQVVDVFAGARYWKVDTILEFGGGLGVLAGKRVREAKSWVDPLLGVKGRTPFGGSKFYAAGWLAGGGFGVGSDNFYDASVNIGYQWTPAIGTTIGYRIFDVKYEEGSFYYDIKQEGLALGLAWAF